MQILLLFYDQRYHRQPLLQCHILKYQGNLLRPQVHRPMQRDPLLLSTKDYIRNKFLFTRNNVFFFAFPLTLFTRQMPKYNTIGNAVKESHLTFTSVHCNAMQ